MLPYTEKMIRGFFHQVIFAAPAIIFERNIGPLTAITAVLVVALSLWLPVRYRKGGDKSWRDRKGGGRKEENGTAESAVACWSQGFGRFKHCGLRPDPLDTSKGPPVYSLEPLDLPLPQLSKVQADALEELARRVAALSCKHRTDPGTLVRFLRARKFDVDKAEKYFRKAAAYWEKHGVRQALSTWNLEAYEQCLRPWWLSGGFLGHGINGEMIAYERLSKCYWPKLSQTLPWHALEKIDIIHCLRSLAACEEDSLRNGIPLGNGILVQDCDGFGWDQVSFQSCVKLNILVQLRNTIMPECLSLILVVRAPSSWVYAWNMFKHILDPGIAEKVRVARPGSETTELLRRYISDDQLPAFLGGTRHIDGDPECRQVLAPGGFPPQATLDRFNELSKSEGTNESCLHEGVKGRPRTGSTSSIDSVDSNHNSASAARDGNSCGACPRRNCGPAR
jgi:hypothetical protein